MVSLPGASYILPLQMITVLLRHLDLAAILLIDFILCILIVAVTPKPNNRTILFEHTLRYICPCPAEFPPSSTDWLRAVVAAEEAGPWGRGLFRAPPADVVLRLTCEGKKMYIFIKLTLQ